MKHIKFTGGNMSKRTDLQNKSIHLYCELLAISLNDAGFEMKAFLGSKSNKFLIAILEQIQELIFKMMAYLEAKQEIDIPWTKENVKNVIWKPVQKAMFSIDSTTKLETAQVSEVYKVVARHVSENTGVFVDFPHEQEKSQ